MIELRLVVYEGHETDPPRLQYRPLFFARFGVSGNIEFSPVENPPVWNDVPLVVLPIEEMIEETE